MIIIAKHGVGEGKYHAMENREFYKVCCVHFIAGFTLFFCYFHARRLSFFCFFVTLLYCKAKKCGGVAFFIRKNP